MKLYAWRTFMREKNELLPEWMPHDTRGWLSKRQLQLSLEHENGRLFSSPALEEERDSLYPPGISRNQPGWQVELVDPFTDRRLHEFLLAIPPAEKFLPQSPGRFGYYGGSKRLVRTALKGILPESIRTRTSKTIFNSLLTTSVTQHWGAYESVFKSGENTEAAQHGYIVPNLFWSRLRRLRDGDVSGDYRHVRGGDYWYVRTILELEPWLRRFQQPRQQLLRVVQHAPQLRITQKQA
jgi:asparagine synthase (glutamine-hydrolysing)